MCNLSNNVIVNDWMTLKLISVTLCMQYAVQGLCNVRVSIRQWVRLSVASINICRRRQNAAASGQRQCRDPRRIGQRGLVRVPSRESVVELGL